MHNTIFDSSLFNVQQCVMHQGITTQHNIKDTTQYIIWKCNTVLLKMVNSLIVALARLNLVPICSYIKLIYKLLVIACPKINGNIFSAQTPRWLDVRTYLMIAIIVCTFTEITAFRSVTKVVWCALTGSNVHSLYLFDGNVTFTNNYWIVYYYWLYYFNHKLNLRPFNVLLSLMWHGIVAMLHLPNVT